MSYEIESVKPIEKLSHNEASHSNARKSPTWKLPPIKMRKPCSNHNHFQPTCKQCIAEHYGVDPDNYYESWLELIGEKLSCGNNPLFIYRAICEMISQEERMKKMIVLLRKRKEDEASE